MGSEVRAAWGRGYRAGAGLQGSVGRGYRAGLQGNVEAGLQAGGGATALVPGLMLPP